MSRRRRRSATGPERRWPMPAQLAASRVDYAAVVGAPPGTLLQPATLPGLPATLEAVLSRADAAEPTLPRSRLTATGSRADVMTARSAYLPTVGVQADFGSISPRENASEQIFHADPHIGQAGYPHAAANSARSGSISHRIARPSRSKSPSRTSSATSAWTAA